MKRVWIIFILILFCNSVCWAVEVAPRITDREIVERLSKLEEGQKAILREMDQRFESIDQRFESLNQRFESIDQRFESIDQKFDQLTNLLIAIISAFAGIVAVTIGFAIWDRRTMIRPFETKVRALENRIEDVADRGSKGSPDNDRLNSLIGVMRKYAGSNKEVADAMRSFNLL